MILRIKIISKIIISIQQDTVKKVVWMVFLVIVNITINLMKETKHFKSIIKGIQHKITQEIKENSNYKNNNKIKDK